MILDSWFYFVSIKTEWCFCDYFCFFLLVFFYYVMFKVHMFPFQFRTRRAATAASLWVIFYLERIIWPLKDVSFFPRHSEIILPMNHLTLPSQVLTGKSEIESWTKLTPENPCVYLLNEESKICFDANNIRILCYSFFL